MRFKAALRSVMYTGVSLLLCGCPKNQVQSRGSAIQTTYGVQTTFSHDARGLEQQFEPFLEVYAKTNADSQNRAFTIFAVPDADKWFATYFAIADIEQLGWDSEAEVNAYKTSLINVMRMWPNAGRFHAHCKNVDRDRFVRFQPRADAVKPKHEVPLESFEIEFVSENGRRFSELVNFVYVNGAYRYVGKGAYPFWSMPDATRK